MIVVRRGAFLPGVTEFYTVTAELVREQSVLWIVLWYDSCMEATDSDHKPVKCLFNLDVAHVDKPIMRQKYVEIMSSNKKVLYLLQGLEAFPEANISTNDIILQDQTPVLKLQNRSTKDRACFEIIGQASNSSDTYFACFPTWLKVSPSVGIISPGQTVEVILQHGDLRGTSGNSLSGANQDKAATLLVKITGVYPTVAKDCNIHVQQNRRSTFPFKGLNLVIVSLIEYDYEVSLVC